MVALELRYCVHSAAAWVKSATSEGSGSFVLSENVTAKNLSFDLRRVAGVDRAK
jgi:hypothetical protein